MNGLVANESFQMHGVQQLNAEALSTGQSFCGIYTTCVATTTLGTRMLDVWTVQGCCCCGCFVAPCETDVTARDSCKARRAKRQRDVFT